MDNLFDDGQQQHSDLTQTSLDQSNSVDLGSGQDFSHDVYSDNSFDQSGGGGETPQNTDISSGYSSSLNLM